MDDEARLALRTLCDAWRKDQVSCVGLVEFREPALAFWSFLKFGAIWQEGTRISDWFADGRAGIIVMTKEGVTLSVPDGHWRPIGCASDPMDEITKKV